MVVSLMASWYFLSGCECNCDEQPIVGELSYEREKFFVRRDNQQQVIKPRLDPPVEGEFWSVPFGLDMDFRTGEINIQTSESGIRYYIFFRSNDGQVTADTELLIAGIDILDTLIDIREIKSIIPIFNADPELPLPTGEPIVEVSERGLLINVQTGEIDLAGTVEELGGGQPFFSEDFTLRINFTEDNVEASSEVTFRILYYENIQDIPERILRELREKQQFPRRKGTDGERPPYVVLHGRL